MQKKRIWLLVLAVYALSLTLLWFFEHQDPNANIHTFFEAFWYSIVTLTTVGYGDYYPVTLAGRIVGLVFVLLSLGLLGFLVSQLTAQLSILMEKRKLGLMGTALSKHVVIIGWDKFGQQVTDQIVESGHPIAIATDNKNDVELIKETYADKNVYPLFTDLNQVETLQKISIEQAGNVFINIPDDTEALVYALNLKQVYPDLSYIVSLNNPKLKSTFSAAGVTYTISKNEIASRMVASYIFEPDVALIAEDMMSTAIQETDFDVQEYRVSEQNPLLGKDYLEAFISLRTEHDCILLGTSKMIDGKPQLIKNPPKSLDVELDDYLIILASGVVKRKIEKVFGVSEGRLN